MNSQQDELAWLNHRLDHKLDAWRRLHRLHGAIAICSLGVVIFLVSLYLSSRAVPKSLVSHILADTNGRPIATLASYMTTAVLIYCSVRSLSFHCLWSQGLDLKNEIYFSCRGDDIKDEKLNDFHNRIGELLKKETGFPGACTIGRGKT
jgi:hypothetical protein